MPTPRSPRHSPRSWRAAAPGSPSSPPARAPRPSRWRSGASEEIDTRVILDERSAGSSPSAPPRRASGRRSVLCTSGTAAANLHPAVAEADEAGVPLIVLTADRPPELRGIGAGQTIDQIKLYGSRFAGSARWATTTPMTPAFSISAASRAARTPPRAASRGPGPVHLNLPWREPLAPRSEDRSRERAFELAREGRGDRPLTEVVPPPRGAGAAILDELAEVITENPRGLILAGRRLDRRTPPRSPRSPPRADIRSCPSRPRSFGSADTTARG